MTTTTPQSLIQSNSTLDDFDNQLIEIKGSTYQNFLTPGKLGQITASFFQSQPGLIYTNLLNANDTILNALQPNLKMQIVQSMITPGTAGQPLAITAGTASGAGQQTLAQSIIIDLFGDNSLAKQILQDLF